MGKNALTLNQNVYSSLIKINNFIGFFPDNLEENLSLLVKELDKLFAPAYASICLRKETFLRVFGEILFKGSCYYICEFPDCWIESHGLPIIVQNLSNEEGCRHHKVSSNIQAYAAIPIMEENNVVGILSLNHPQVEFFTNEVLEVLLVMANLGAISIHQWRLLTKLQREKRELEDANRAIKNLVHDLAENVEQLKNAQKQLIHSEKLAATGRLAADIAHEINNPIGIIVSRLECMLLDGEQVLPEELIADINVVANQASRISKITRSLLSFARVPVEEKNTVDLNGIMDETLSLLQNHLRKHKINVHEELCQEVAQIWGSGNQLQQVFVNLINNAMDAMPDGGNLYLRTKIIAESVQVEIEDDGSGIPTEQLDKIFDPFYTTKGKGVGTGLGLAISYGLVEEHKGKIEVVSQGGEGTRFSLIFPLFLPKPIA